MSLLAELKRRRVFRVAGAYLVGAWIVLQVADTLFPALHLPPWTVTLVAAAAVIGFPIALLLGWAFDITPGGIERTTSTERISFPVRAAMVGTLLVFMGVSGFLVVRRRAVAAKLDANAVVVLPFRVAGDASLSVMREGMVDLLAAKLTGEGGPRAIDSRTTLSAWRRKVANERDDMPAADAVQLARSLGAGQVLLGEVIGTPGKVVVNATLHSSVDGRTTAKASDAAPPDSMLQIVDRVVAKLLSEQAGEGHRIEQLLSESLTAVQAYLDGARLYRRGYHSQAAERFNAALEEDSTFALAAIGLGTARSWSGFGADYARAQRIAWTYRERLPSIDREMIHAWLGDSFPQPMSPREQLRRWESLVARVPDRVEAQYELGDEYYHKGAIVGYEDSDDRALKAWTKALALDSAYVPALAHQIPIYAQRGDTASVRRITSIMKRIQPDLLEHNITGWVAATALRDEAWLKELRSKVDSATQSEARNAMLEIVLSGLDQTDVPLLIDAAVRNSATPSSRLTNLHAGASYYLNLGRPAAALALLEHTDGAVSESLRFIYHLGFYGDHPDIDSTSIAAALGAADSLAAKMPQVLCIVSGLRILRDGDYSLARTAIAKLREAGQANAGAFGTAGVCAYAREAAVKVHDKAPDAKQVVARLDSVLLNSAVLATWREHFALESMRYHQELGDLEGALAAAKRVQRDQGYARGTLLLERARLASRLGRRDEAIATYQLFLKMRANPEPGRATETVAQARRELAALTGER